MYPKKGSIINVGVGKSTSTFSPRSETSHSPTQKRRLDVHALKKDVLKPMTLWGAISLEPTKIFSVFFMPEKASVPSKA